MARQTISSKANSPSPAILAFACVALGAWIAGSLPPAPAWTLGVVTLACAGGSLLARRRLRIALLGAGAVALGVCAFEARVANPPADALGPLLRATGDSLLRVEGVIVSEPEDRPRAGRFARYTFQADATAFRLRAERVLGPDGSATPISGLLSVRVRGPAPTLHAGQRVRVTGRALASAGASNPAPTSMLRWASQANWAGAIVTSDARNIHVAATNPASLHATRAALQRRAGRWMQRDDMPDDARAVLAGALLGAEEPELADVRRTLERVGAAHVLAISGLHLAALSWLLLLALRPFPFADRWAPLLIALVVVLYAWIVPARPAVVRAAIMVVVFLAAEASGRRYNRLAVLALAAITVLLWRPLELTRPGFQLTFAVVAALVGLAEPLRARLFGGSPIDPDLDRLRDRFVLASQRTMAGALAAWLVATPLLAFHFGILNPLAPLGAMLLAPLFALTLALGQAATLLSAVAPSAALWLAAPVGSLAHVTILCADALSQVPGAFVRLPALSLIFPVAFLALLVWWVFSTRASRLQALATAVFALALGASLLHSARSAGLARDVALRIDTFDVGDGTCHLLRTRGGALLWDAGGSDLDAGVREIPLAIRTLGAWRVPDVVITHANVDHYALLPDLLEPLGVKRVHVSPFMFEAMRLAESGPLLELRAALAGVTVLPVRAGDTLPFGAHAFEFLWPGDDASQESVNNTSLVARITLRDANGRTLLLTGDVEDEAITLIRTQNAELRADVMEVPHHGSARIEAMDWMFAVDPSIVIQSTGRSRVGDDRWADARAGRRWLTTAVEGSIGVEIRRDGAIRSTLTSERTRPR